MDGNVPQRHEFVRAIQGLPPSHHRFGEGFMGVIFFGLFILGPLADWGQLLTKFAAKLFQ